MQTVIQFRRGQYRITRFGGTQRLAADYGEIIGTKGADGEPIDVYQGLFPDADAAFIVNQYRPDGVFDEHKVMLHFYDQEQAAHAYALTTGKPPANIYPCTLQQLDWWLQFGNHKTPVTPQSFPFDSENMMQEQTHDWTNENQAAAKWLYAQRNDDPYGTLTEAATLDCIMQDELEDGAEIEEAVYDALAVANKRLERTAKLLGAAFNRASGSLKVVENGIQISAPMKKNGTTNVAVMFEMTDGQTVSVLLHNPDTTPAKITPDDVLISWKWLLNRKDITIVVAKENGKDLPLPTVARRVMALVEKNTARFAKANANKAAETELLAQLEAEKTEKIARLEELNRLVEEKAGQPETHYSEQIIQALINDFGWKKSDDDAGENASISAVLEYHAPSRAGQLNPSGMFTATASFYPDLPRQRYLSLLVGFDEPINIDCRDDGLAGRYHEAAEKFDKQARAWLVEHEGAIFDNKEQPETEPIAPDAGMSPDTVMELQNKYARDTFVTDELENLLGENDDGDILDDKTIIDDELAAELNDKQKAVLLGRTAAFASALVMIEKVCNQGDYIVEFGNFEHTRSKGLFDGLRDYTQGYGIVAQIMDTNMFNRENVMRVDVDSQGRCVVFKYASGTETLQKQRISYKNIKDWLDKTSVSMTNEMEAKKQAEQATQPENNNPDLYDAVSAIANKFPTVVKNTMKVIDWRNSPLKSVDIQLNFNSEADNGIFKVKNFYPTISIRQKDDGLEVRIDGKAQLKEWAYQYDASIYDMTGFSTLEEKLFRALKAVLSYVENVYVNSKMFFASGILRFVNAFDGLDVKEFRNTRASFTYRNVDFDIVSGSAMNSASKSFRVNKFDMTFNYNSAENIAKKIKRIIEKNSKNSNDDENPNEQKFADNEQSENNATQPNDRTFLQALVDGKEDAANEAVIDRALMLAEQHATDPDWQDLIEQAAEALAKAGIADTDDLAQGE